MEAFFLFLQQLLYLLNYGLVGCSLSLIRDLCFPVLLSTSCIIIRVHRLFSTVALFLALSMGSISKLFKADLALDLVM
jgi:hypothetical protein